MSELTDAEREALIVDALECIPWHYTEFGVLCSCGRAVDTSDDTCQMQRAMQRAVIETVERILSDRLAQQREDIATAIEGADDFTFLHSLDRQVAAKIARGDS